MKNYTKISSKYVSEVSSNVTIWRHNKTNARIATFENDDTNKVFSIAFRTPAINNTGLTHILEHSVLCGSKKYPVKDPFVELLKSSLNTFLNAFTFPDKTMYPCASQNDKDFANLMDVYMDAVLNPQIYNHKEIFMQEGWHYHLTNKNDNITYNGVVYNEMKGAFSNPTQLVQRNIQHSLFPDTAYGFESGGDPEFIPDLSYEEFKTFHSKFYHPSNSFIYLYGNCNMEERLEFLDREYLSKFDAIDFNTEVKYQKPFDKPVYVNDYYPVGEDESLKDKTYLSYNVVLPYNKDPKALMATEILLNSLFDIPGAPLKEALVNAKLGQDVLSYIDDDLLQPVIAIVVFNSNKEDEKRFINLVNDELNKLVKNGLNKESLLSIINYSEFKARERGFSAGTPQGLNTILKSCSSWLYDDNDVTSKLEVFKYFDELREDVKNGYFEKLIEKYLINNNHKSFVSLEPSYTIAKERQEKLDLKLKNFKESLSEEEIDNLVAMNLELEQYQKTPDTKEAINTLPKLSIDDISKDPLKYNLEVLNNNPFKVLFSNYETNDIAYMNYYFDITNISTYELKFLSLYCDLFTNLSTSNYHYSELSKIILNYTGSLNLDIQTVSDYKAKKTKTLLKLSYSALTNNINYANELSLDILNNTLFEDEKRLYERICEIKLELEMGLSNRGHQYALRRAGSYVDEDSYINDNIDGISYIDFISDIANDFDNVKANLIKELKALKDKVFTKESFILGFTGTKDMLNKTEKYALDFYNSLSDKSSYKKELFHSNIKNEGIKAEFNVNYVARFGKYKEEFNGGLYVLAKALNYDYLWQKVRVLGGAYGCFLALRDGSIGFTSYRDPNIKKTNDTYNEIYEFISNLEVSEDDLLKFKIGAIADIDLVLHNKGKGQLAQKNYLSNLEYDDIKKTRLELINAKASDLKSFKDLFKEALDYNAICVIGNSNKVIENKELFKEIRNLTK